MVVRCRPLTKDHLPLRTAFSGPKGDQPGATDRFARHGRSHIHIMVVRCRPLTKDHLPLKTAFSGPKGWSLVTGFTVSTPDNATHGQCHCQGQYTVKAEIFGGVLFSVTNFGADNFYRK